MFFGEDRANVMNQSAPIAQPESWMKQAERLAQGWSNRLPFALKEIILVPLETCARNPHLVSTRFALETKIKSVESRRQDSERGRFVIWQRIL